MASDWHTKIIDIGNSKGVILPKILLRLLEVDKKGTWVKVSLSPRSQAILIAKTKKPKNIL
jgi:antitoxin component of MazEF toxin-antitoxin module